MAEPTSAVVAERKRKREADAAEAAEREEGRSNRLPRHRLKELVKRPARKQADKVESEIQADGEYNIWYHKVQSSEYREHNAGGPRVLATTRVNLELDVGWTQGDKNPEGVICLHFARGKCIKGQKCSFRHTLPTLEEEKRLDAFHDVFGRDRHALDKEDMSGVGSFTKENTTLYLGGVVMRPGYDREDMMKLIYKEFEEFGHIVKLNFIMSKRIAFVRYEMRVSAEFAREAMNNQAMGGTNQEVLAVRWAREDPNPRAIAEDKVENIRRAVEALEQHVQANASEFSYPANYAMQAPGDVEQKALQGADAVSAYPQTADQYNAPQDEQKIVAYDSEEDNGEEEPAAEGAGVTEQKAEPTEEERAAAWAAYYKQQAEYQQQQYGGADYQYPSMYANYDPQAYYGGAAPSAEDVHQALQNASALDSVLGKVDKLAEKRQKTN